MRVGACAGELRFMCVGVFSVTAVVSVSTGRYEVGTATVCVIIVRVGACADELRIMGADSVVSGSKGARSASVFFELEFRLLR